MIRAGVKVRNGNVDEALKRFNEQVYRNGVLIEYMENTFYTKPSVKKRVQKNKQIFENKNRHRYLD